MPHLGVDLAEDCASMETAVGPKALNVGEVGTWENGQESGERGYQRDLDRVARGGLHALAEGKDSA